jgi:cytidine deaminase
MVSSSNLDPHQITELIDQSINAMDRAYAPYSEFRVGAALLCEDGSIFHGANIENISFTPTVCAERTAFFRAIMEGKREFSAISVVSSDGQRFTPPCGVCRQVMSEFVKPSFQIILVRMDREYQVLRFDQLFPYPVDPQAPIGRKKQD